MAENEHPIRHEHRLLNRMCHHEDRNSLQLPDVQ
jgi:hypothetical protein